MARRKTQPRRGEAPQPSKDESRRPLLGGILGLVALLWWAQVAISGPSPLRIAFAVGVTALAVLTLAPLFVRRALVRLLRSRRPRS